MTHCLTCDAEKHPVQKFTSKGIVDACPTCETVFARQDVTPPAEVDENASPIVAAPRPAQSTPSKPATQPSDALSLLDQLRARMAYCEEQIAARDGFIAERDMLRKMLAAAESETQPVVHGVAGPLGFTN